MIDPGSALATGVVPILFDGYNSVEFALWSTVLVSGLLGSFGAAYLLYVDTIVVHYTRFFKIVALGLLLFVGTAPVVFFFAVEFIHGAHALAVVVISAGLYSLVRSEHRTEDFEAVFSVGAAADRESSGFVTEDE